MSYVHCNPYSVPKYAYRYNIKLYHSLYIVVYIIIHFIILSEPAGTETMMALVERKGMGPGGDQRRTMMQYWAQWTRRDMLFRINLCYICVKFQYLQ